MVFILDEFQEFATRSKQTLLYTLLDILQSGETQMAVVGLTEKIDVVESLEKRIQSRFSHRQIFIPPISFENKLDVIKSRLLLSQAFMNNQDNISNNNNNNDDNKNKRGRKKTKGNGQREKLLMLRLEAVAERPLMYQHSLNDGIMKFKICSRTEIFEMLSRNIIIMAIL